MRYDVIVAGGGLSGLMLACLLGDSPLSVAVVEGRPPPRDAGRDYDLRVSAVTPASRALFERIDVWRRLDARRIGRIERMRVWEEPTRALHFAADEIGAPELGYIVENRALSDALWERAGRLRNITIHRPIEIREINDDDSAIAVSTDKSMLQAQLLVGADGVHSRVRQQTRIDVSSWDYGQDAIVAYVRGSKPCPDTAWQRFLTTGPLAFLPMPESDLSSIVWSCTRERARELMKLDDAAFAHELHVAFGDALGELRVTSARASFSLAGAHASGYVRPRIALIGDAVHRVHPLAGQGANLGFGDAAALAEALLVAQAKRRDIGDYGVLRRYERERKEANVSILAVTDVLYRLFGAQHAGVRALGSWGLGLVDRAPFVKRGLLARAMGMSRL